MAFDGVLWLYPLQCWLSGDPWVVLMCAELLDSVCYLAIMSSTMSPHLSAVRAVTSQSGH